MAVAIIVCQPFVDLIQSILYGSPHFNAVLLNHLRIKYWLSIFPERCSKLYTDDEWLEKAAFWTCLQDKYYDNFTRKLLSARPMEITSCVDVAVLPRDFSHEITWKHCFRNWLRTAYQLVDHLYKSFSAKTRLQEDATDSKDDKFHVTYPGLTGWRTEMDKTEL